MGNCRKRFSIRLPNLGHQKHVSKGILLARSDVKKSRSSFFCHHRRKGPKCLPLLNQTVDAVTHRRVSRVRQNAAVSQGTGPEFHPSLVPGYDLTFVDARSSLPTQLFVGLCFDPFTVTPHLQTLPTSL